MRAFGLRPRILPGRVRRERGGATEPPRSRAPPVEWREPAPFASEWNVLELIRGLHNLRPRHRGCVLTIGVFDGVHAGHRALLERLAVLGEDFNLPSMLMVFEPHPQEVLDYLVTPARITGFREKMLALRSTPVDRVLCVRFDRKFAAVTANEFIDALLVAKLGVRHLVVGDDFRFGHQAEGDVDLLRTTGARCGFSVHRRDTYRVEGDRVSSTRIRNMLALGRLDAVTPLLGRRFSVQGRVRHGRHLGAGFGFPTANFALRRPVCPISGVFTVRMRLEGEGVAHPGVANVGVRPTVEGTERRLEVHLLGFSGDLYGRYAEVEFFSRLREERRFESLDALRAQIARDVRAARELFAARMLG